jgi:chromobox protein 1
VINRFVVESILQHKWDSKANQFTYKVKWLGYNNPRDLTWEPAKNLETASDIVNDYHNSIGGSPQPPEKPSKKQTAKPTTKKRPLEEETRDSKRNSGARRGRKKQNTGEDDSSENLIQDVPITRTKYPPKNQNEWDKYITCVNTIEEVPNKMGTKDRWGIVSWNNGELTRHRLAQLHTNAPQSVSPVSIPEVLTPLLY